LEDSRVLQKVIDEKLLSDDTSSSFREASAKALTDIGRRCDVRAMNLDVNVMGKLASRAFLLKNSIDDRVKKMWEEVWSEYSVPLSTFAGFIIDFLLKTLQSQDRNDRITAAKAAVELVNGCEGDVEGKLASLSTCLQQSLSSWKGIGEIVKASAEVALKVYQLTKDRNQCVTALELCQAYAMKGHHDDRQLACKSVLVLIQKGMLHAELGYEGAHKLYTVNCEYMNTREEEIEKERAETLVDPHLPKIRGKPLGDEFFIPLFDVYAEIFECAKEVQMDENDIEPPDAETLNLYLSSWLFEFLRGALALRLSLLRSLTRVFRHLKTIKAKPVRDDEVLKQVVASWSDERIRIRVTSFDTLAAVWDAGWEIDDATLRMMISNMGQDVKSEIDLRQLEHFHRYLREME